ncbi:hypothetical protein GN156_16110 [bacterium LRH843]|nr:hypothetical protein [bacterium LRH843]
MSQLIDQIKSFTRNIGENIIDLFKNQSEKSVKISELITFITLHKNCAKTKQELLGLVFNTYKIATDTFDVKLETKGNHNEQFLEFIVQAHGHALLTFKGYEQEKLSAESKIKIPQPIFDQLQKD